MIRLRKTKSKLVSFFGGLFACVSLLLGTRLTATAIDTKAIESLCTWLNCQPNDIMEVIPNTWDNADRLCEILKCTKEDLPSRVPMEEK